MENNETESTSKFETNKTETTSNLKPKWTKKQRLKPKIIAHDQQRTKEHILIGDDQAEVKTRDSRFRFVVFRFWYWDISWIEFRNLCFPSRRIRYGIQPIQEGLPGLYHLVAVCL